MSAEELGALAEKLQAEAGKRGLECHRPVRRIIVEEGSDMAAELAKLGNADHVIIRVIVKAGPAPDDRGEEPPPPKTDEKGDEETQTQNDLGYTLAGPDAHTVR